MSRHYAWIVAAVAAAIFLGTVLSPPSLMDDVDSAHAQIARTMLESGDWVTARLNGVVYLDKAPLTVWMIAASYRVFGVHDWAARIPLALGAIALCLVTARFAAWAFSPLAGLLAGLSLACSIGLFLFTRILIPDASLSALVAFALWCFLRALEGERGRWPLWIGLALGAGLLLKGLIAVLLPGGAAFVYLLATRQLFRAAAWRRLAPWWIAAAALAVAAPWYVAATLANPPYLDFTLRSRPGEFRGFFWRYFINEHLLRYLNLRHPRDYDTVPRWWFWLMHLVWLFPWTPYLAGVFGQSFRGSDRASRTRLLALCWAGFVLVFFTFSTTQEYYSLPAYGAFGLLIGSAAAAGTRAARLAPRISAGVALLALAVILVILVQVWNLPTPGDIAAALKRNPEAYTLSLGHMGDLSLASFAYLRQPLLLAALAFAAGGAALFLRRGWAAIAALAGMMVLLVHAARLAMVTFEPYLGSRALGEAALRYPGHTLLVADEYYAFSSVFFYANRQGLLLYRRNNLEYGSHAPGAPAVFVPEGELAGRFRGADKYFVLVTEENLPRLRKLAGDTPLREVMRAGGKVALINRE